VDPQYLNPFTRHPGELPACLLGRHAAMTRLRLALDVVRRGVRSDLVHLHGPPGTGRTVLLELVRTAAEQLNLRTVAPERSELGDSVANPGAQILIADDIDAWRNPQQFFVDARRARQRAVPTLTVTAGARPVLAHDQLARDHNSVALALLTREQAALLLTATAEKGGREWAPEAVDLIVTVSAGYPDVLQSLGFAAWFEAVRATSPTITEDHAQEAVISGRLNEAFTKKLGQIRSSAGFSRSARALEVLSAANEPISADELAAQISKTTVSQDALIELCRELATGGFVTTSVEANTLRYQVTPGVIGDALRADRSFGLSR